MIGDDLGEATLIMLPTLYYICVAGFRTCVCMCTCVLVVCGVCMCVCVYVLAAFYFCLSGHLSAPECLQMLYVQLLHVAR